MPTLESPITNRTDAPLVSRVLPPEPILTLTEHLAHFGAAPARGAALIEDVEAAGLRGRGGAGFPTAVKMRAVAAGRRPVVVANGTEGEPASGKDKTLLATAAHLVLDGIAAAADALGAQEAVVCIERCPPLYRRLRTSADRAAGSPCRQRGHPDRGHPRLVRRRGGIGARPLAQWR